MALLIMTFCKMTLSITLNKTTLSIRIRNMALFIMMFLIKILSKETFCKNSTELKNKNH
jgi:hypothetical protein